MRKRLFFIFLLSFLLRLIALNQSLWLDEAITARVVKEYEWTQIVSEFSPNDFHPPLYYLFMKIWSNVFGYSEISLRFPSIIFSLLTGWVVYLIAGIWPATFFLFNPLIVYYSQEARMYMMVTFFLTGALYYFIKISNLKAQMSNLKLKSQILFGLFLILSLLTFYGSIFLIASFLLYFLFKKQYKSLVIGLLVMLGYFLLIGPLLYQQFINSKIALANVTNWSLVLGKANLKNLLLIPVKFSIGRIDFYPKWLYYLVAGTWTGFVLFETLKIKNSIKIKNLKLKIPLVYLFIFPLLLGFVISFFTPLLQYFRFIYLIPIMAILLSFRVTNQAKIHHSGIAWGIMTGFITLSLVYLLIPKFHREDWKSLAKDIPARSVVYMIKSSSDPIKYYNNKIKIKELKSLMSVLVNPSLPYSAGGGQLGELEKQIIIIPYTAAIHGVDYQSTLFKYNYKLKNRVNFRDVFYEIWIKD